MSRLFATSLLACALVCVVNGAGQAQLATGDPATQFQLSDWVAGVNNVTDLEFLSDGRAVVIRKTGQIALVSRDGNLLNPMAASLQVDSTSEKGLLGVVRDSSDNLYFYASTGADSANKHKVYKGRVNADGTVTVDLDNPVVSGGLEGPANHDGGGLIIHKGQLYVGVGDTGQNATPPRNKYGACLNKPNGKILRVNLDGSIPQDNPLVALAMVTGCASPVQGMYELAPPDKRIYAWGFRNPWRFWIDAETDLLWIGDVGETTQEEITVGGKGVNHGWPFVEGTMKYAGLGGLTDCTQMTPSTPCKPPEDTYIRGGSSASVTGGLVPRKGCGWGAYEQKYFFGDYNRATIWTLDLKPDRTGAVPGSRKTFAMLSSPVSFKMGPDGAMYIAAHQEGSVKRIAPKSIPATCAAAAPTPDAGSPDSAPVGGAGGGGAGGSGGPGGAGGAGGMGMAGAGGTGGSSADAGSATTSTDSGCGCALGGAGRSGAGLMLLLLGVGLATFRRRRSR